jgi:hypothetical protein
MPKKTAKFNGRRAACCARGHRGGAAAVNAQVAAVQVDAPAPGLPKPGATRPVRHRGQTARCTEGGAGAEAHEVPQQSKVFAALEHKFRVVE